MSSSQCQWEGASSAFRPHFLLSRTRQASSPLGGRGWAGAPFLARMLLPGACRASPVFRQISTQTCLLAPRKVPRHPPQPPPVLCSLLLVLSGGGGLLAPPWGPQGQARLELRGWSSGPGMMSGRWCSHAACTWSRPPASWLHATFDARGATSDEILYVPVPHFLYLRDGDTASSLS